MELVDGTLLDRLLAEGAPTGGHRARLRGADRGRARGGARERHHPSRHQAGEHRDHARRPRESARFRTGETDRAGADEATITAVATEPGIVMGTAAYMSPEQAEGRPVDARSDIFSFGAVLYEMLAGRRPFSGSTHVGVIMSILRDQPAPVRTLRDGRACRRRRDHSACAAKDPAARYQDASALRADLAAAHAKLTRPAEGGLAPTSGPRSGRRPAPGGGRLQRLAADARARGAAGPTRNDPADREASVHRSFARGRAARRTGEPIAPEEIDASAMAGSTSTSTRPPRRRSVDPELCRTSTAVAPLGTTPIRGSKVPFVPYRVRITKAGFVPVDISHPVGSPDGRAR